MELVSVIIPVYNVEKYINRCVDSVVKQTYHNLEIILIDDGSTDNCPHICEQWASRDSRIRVIHKQNAGLGMARNTGIENASGQYICFFDSDDYVEVSAIEEAYNSIVAYNADIASFGMASVDSSGNVVSSRIPRVKKELYFGDGVQNYLLPGMLASEPGSGKDIGLSMSACARMYSMELINKTKWRFVSERDYISEDFYSLLILYQHVERVSIIGKVLYYYCYNPKSLTHLFDENRLRRIITCYTGMNEICNRAQYSDAVRRALDIQFIASIIAALKLIVKSKNTLTRKLELINDALNQPLLVTKLCSVNVKKETLQRRIAIIAMKKKQPAVLYFLVQLKCRK